VVILLANDILVVFVCNAEIDVLILLEVPDKKFINAKLEFKIVVPPVFTIKFEFNCIDENIVVPENSLFEII
jgi:hypothetical protein